jgi:hypothetical protein
MCAGVSWKGWEFDLPYFMFYNLNIEIGRRAETLDESNGAGVSFRTLSPACCIRKGGAPCARCFVPSS